MQYLIIKNGHYLSQLFVDDIRNNGFKATRPQDAYKYDVEQIARDIAANLDAEIEIIE